jgi:hypothetical protein
VGLRRASIPLTIATHNKLHINVIKHFSHRGKSATVYITKILLKALYTAQAKAATHLLPFTVNSYRVVERITLIAEIMINNINIFILFSFSLY